MSKISLSLLLVVSICFVSSIAVSRGNEMTKEKIIQIAINKAEDLGYRTEEMDVVYDEGNKSIKEHSSRIGVSTYNEKTKKWEKDLPTTPEKEYLELKDRDYQAVYFGLKGSVLGGDLWIFIDRNTGEIIRYVRGR